MVDDLRPCENCGNTWHDGDPETERLIRYYEGIAVAKIRYKVRQVLELEIAQLDGFLNRHDPNVQGAVGRLRILKDLCREVGGDPNRLIG